MLYPALLQKLDYDESVEHTSLLDRSVNYPSKKFSCIVRRPFNGAMTIDILTLSITTSRIAILSITTLRKTTHSITIRKCHGQHNDIRN